MEEAVETEPHRVEIEIGGRGSAGGEDPRGAVEAVVQILDPRGPVRGKREFGASAGRPAEMPAKDFVLVATDTRDFQEAGLRRANPVVPKNKVLPKT